MISKYKTLYDELIYFRQCVQPIIRWNKLPAAAKAVNLPPTYAEFHHVLPKSLYPEYINDQSNIVSLLAYEHVLAHFYLAMWYRDQYGEDSKEYMCMLDAYFKTTHKNTGRGVIELTAAEAAELKIEASRLKTLRQTGRKWTAEHHYKTAQFWKNHPEYREATSKRFKGKKIDKDVLLRRTKTRTTPEYSKKMTAVQKAAQNRKDVNDHRSSTLKQTLSRPDVRLKMQAAAEEASKRPEALERQRQKFIAWNKDPEMKQKQQHRTAEQQLQLSRRVAVQNQNPEIRAKQQFSKARNRFVKLALWMIVVYQL